MKTYSIFLDDERWPVISLGTVYICRNYDQIVKLVDVMIYYERKLEFISFDHDLGDGQKTGMDVAKYLVDMDMDHSIFDVGFSFFVHSQNPVGATNINSYVSNYLKAKENNES